MKLMNDGSSGGYISAMSKSSFKELITSNRNLKARAEKTMPKKKVKSSTKNKGYSHLLKLLGGVE